MHTAPCPSTIRLSRPLHSRLLDSAADSVRQLHAAWVQYQEERRLQRELDAMADMDAMLLRDIGAPEWLITRASVRRDAHQQELRELHQWRRSFD